MTWLEMRDTVIRYLTRYLSRPVYLSNQVQPEPEYPYAYYTLIQSAGSSGGMGNISFEARPSEEPEFNTDVISRRTELVTAVFSFTIVSRNREIPGGYIYGDNEAMELAEKAAGYFIHAGVEELSLEDITVVDVGNVSDRSVIVIDDTDRKYGFDVTIRYESVIERNDRTVEKVNLIKRKR